MVKCRKFTTFVDYSASQIMNREALNQAVGVIREQVPALGRTVYGKPLIYLDNAATAQKPVAVLERVHQMNAGVNGNVHRAVHRLSEETTQWYEEARDAVKELIGAAERAEVIFTSGTTASINTVAYAWSFRFLKAGDVVLVSQAEHHSNIVPWQLACERTGATLRVLPVDESGQWRMDLLPGLLDERVRMVAVSHISNVLGLVNPVQELIRQAHAVGACVLIDGAQGIVHERVDVQALDCDFYVFSGHKLYAETGTGILYGKRRWLEAMPPFLGGGDMVDTVTFAKTTYAALPLKFEAGTGNFIGAASLAPAIDFAKSMMTQELEENQKEIIDYLNEELNKIEGLKIYGQGANKIPLFSFAVAGCNHGDIATLLDKLGIAVRSGLMCCEPLISGFGHTGLVRASFAPYNTLEEAQTLVQGLHRVVRMLR